MARRRPRHARARRFPVLLNKVADVVGVKDPPNLLLFAAALLLLLVCVHLSWEASRLEEKTRTLAEEVALLSPETRGRVGFWSGRAA